MRAWRISLNFRVKCMLVVGVAAVGLGVGFELQKFLRSRPRGEKSTSQLLRELRKQDSKLDLWRQAIWRKLPRFVTRDWLWGLTPYPAASVRYSAAFKLKSRELEPTKAVPVLIAGLQDPYFEIPKIAIEVLAMLGGSAKPAIPALIQFVTTNKQKSALGFADLRGEAILALAAIAPDHPSLLPLLKNALNEQDTAGAPTSFARSAITALERIAPKVPAAFPALISAAEQGNPALTASIIDALARRSPPDPQILDCVIGSLTNANLRLLMSAVSAVARLGPSASNAVPALMATFERLRKEAVNDDGRLPSNPDLSAKLVTGPDGGLYRFLPMDGPRWRREILHRIICAFGEIGPAAAPALPLFEADLNKPISVYSRFGTALARWQIDQNLESVWQVFKDGSQDRNLYTRRSTANYLAQMGDKTLPLLLEMAHDSDKSVRASVVTSLATIGEKALPALIQALDDPEIQVRLHGIDALAALGPAARPAIPALEQRLKAPKYVVRSATAIALKKIQPGTTK